MMKIQKYIIALNKFKREFENPVCIFSISKPGGSFDPICISLKEGELMQSKNMGFIVIKKYNTIA
jgi:hypothetical protein